MSYVPAEFSPFDDSVIGPWSRCSIGAQMTAINLVAPTDVVWQTANQAIYVPFTLERAQTIYQVGWLNGATATTGTHEIGVYNADGTTKIISGAAAGGTVSVIQKVDVTDTILQPGLYWLAMTNTSTAGHWWSYSPAAPQVASLGILTQATANPLPSSATFAISQTITRIPVGFLQCRSVL